MAGGTLNLLSNSSVSGNFVYGQNGYMFPLYNDHCNGGAAMGGGIFQANGTLNSPSGTNNVTNNTATPGNAGTGTWGLAGLSAPNYSRSGGNTCFTANSTANAQSTAGLYQSAGSLNQSAMANKSQLKRLPGIVIEL